MVVESHRCRPLIQEHSKWLLLWVLLLTKSELTAETVGWKALIEASF